MDIVKWGNSAAIRLPAAVLGQLGVQVGDVLDASIADGVLALRRAKPRGTEGPAGAAIEFAVVLGSANGGLDFLRCWRAGEVETIRKRWPDAPVAIFAGLGSGA